MNKKEEAIGKKHGLSGSDTRRAIDHIINGYLSDKQIVKETKKFTTKFLKALTRSMGYKVSQVKDTSFKVT